MNIQQDHTSICAAIENDVYDFWHKVAVISENKVSINDDLSWVMSETSDWPNRIFRARFNPADVNEKISTVVKQIKLGMIPKIWTVTPSSVPKDLGKQLLAHGFYQHNVQSGMAIDLVTTNIIPKQQNSELIIHRCCDPDTLRQLKFVSDTAFNRNVNFDIFVKMLNEKSIHFYVGSIHDQVVATLVISYSATFAGLHLVTTHPNYRKRGIAAAMVRNALYNIQKQGYPFAVLQASQLGEGVYQKIGFKKYLDLTHYALDPSTYITTSYNTI